MILRIVLGHLSSRTQPAALTDLRDRLSRGARDVPGLDSLILGVRRPDDDADTSRPVDAAIVTVWTDAEPMVRAVGTGPDDEDRLLQARLQLPIEIERADHFEIIGRTFAALPPDRDAYLRIVRVRSRPNEEAHLMETLRRQQPRLVELGLVASHLGRRVLGSEVEAVTVGVWPDRAAIQAATSGGPERPLYAHELESWADRLTLDTYDGIEIAPKLPVASGPPIFVLDDDLRIVDLTAAAAAALGWTAQDLVGQSLRDLSLTESAQIDGRRSQLLGEGIVSGEATWLVPDDGRVFIRFVARRDVPIPGRHAVLVRRVSEPAPDAADLEAALREAFPTATD